MHDLKWHGIGVMCVAFSPDGTRIVIGSGGVTVCDAQTFKQQFELQGLTSTVMSVAFSPDGSQIVAGLFDNTAKVCDAKTGDAPAGPEGAHGPGA